MVDVPCDIIGEIRPLNLAITTSELPLSRISVNNILKAFNSQNLSELALDYRFSKMSYLYNLHGTAKCFVRRLSSDLPSDTTSTA